MHFFMNVVTCRDGVLHVMNEGWSVMFLNVSVLANVYKTNVTNPIKHKSSKIILSFLMEMWKDTSDLSE